MRTRDRADARLIPFPTRRPTIKGDRPAMHPRPVTSPTGARERSRPSADRTVITRRVSGPVALKERTVMYSSSFPDLGPGLYQVHMVSRQRDLLAEAERARRLEQAEGADAALRHWVGTALVVVGERIARGAGSTKPAAESIPSATTLRCAR